jgi:hypothetical protein
VLKEAPREEREFGVFYFRSINGENRRKQRTACRICRRAPLHPGFVLECETRRIRPRRIDGWRVEFDGDERWQLTGLSKREPKVCYWTEGVPSVEKTGFGRTKAVAAAN